ncbi:MAG TPA: hypothetical protein VI935_03395 [Thermodesulfobacteriota bacterium]|nr:hypothetical protein [Thermodesulfobacteriota bacterium]
MKKHSKNTNQHFEKLLARFSKLPEVEKKRMFGYESFFTHGRCFGGIRPLGVETSVVLRLSHSDYTKAVKSPSLFSPFRNTKDWVECKATSLKDVIKLMPWIELSYFYARRGI